MNEVAKNYGMECGAEYKAEVTRQLLEALKQEEITERVRKGLYYDIEDTLVDYDESATLKDSGYSDEKIEEARSSFEYGFRLALEKSA